MKSKSRATEVPRRRVRMSDVAAAAGVGIMTVSRALRSDASISNDTRQHILKVIDELGYVPDSLAGALSSKRSGFVAILLHTISNSNLSDTVAALDHTIEGKGLQLLIGNTGHTLEKEELLVEAMLRRRPEAFVLTGGIHTPRTRKLLSNAGIPIVESFELPENPIEHVVGFSNAVAAKKMVHRLHADGYRNIAFIGGTLDRATRGAERRQGYLEAIEELGLGRGRVVSLGTPPITMQHGSEAVVRLIEQYPDVDAALCVSDQSAFGAIMECHRRGWAVPERLAIAGFGDAEIAGICHPSITTVAIDNTGIGHEIGHVLLDALAAARLGRAVPPTTHLIEYRIVVRGSTGAGSAAR